MNKENEFINQRGRRIDSFYFSIPYTGKLKKESTKFYRGKRPEVWRPLYHQFNQILRETYEIQVETGIFGAMMDVSFTNNGPVTLIVES